MAQSTCDRRSAQDLRCFTDSAVLLRQMLPALRQSGLVRGLLAGCHARLEALLTDGADTRLVACELRCLNGQPRDLVREPVKDCLRMAAERRRGSQPPTDA